MTLVPTTLPTTLLPTTGRVPRMTKVPAQRTMLLPWLPAQRYSARSPSSWSCCNPRARGQA
jgi:hypothetical protein